MSQGDKPGERSLRDGDAARGFCWVRGLGVARQVGAMSVAVGLVALLAAACSRTVGDAAAVRAGDLACADDSQSCIQARARGLQALRADNDRSWLKRQPTAAEYAAGVRLFALKKDASRLSCAELSLGLSEAQGSERALRNSAGARLNPAHVSRALMLADEVARDLSRERKRRC